MTYRVVLSETAEQELKAAARWWADHRSSEQAVAWYDGFIDALASLANHPERCPFARENHRFAFDIRALHYGVASHPTHRAVFTIRPETVLVLTIRHGAQVEVADDDL